MIKKLLIIFAREVGWMIRRKRWTFILDFFQKNIQAILFHGWNRFPNKLEYVNIFDKLVSLIESNSESSIRRISNYISLLFQLLIWYYLLAVPSQPRYHLLHLSWSLIKLFYLCLNFLFEFTPVWFVICTNRYSEVHQYIE